MAQKNKHSGAKFKQHKEAQKKAKVNRVTTLGVRKHMTNPNTGDLRLDESLKARAADAVARQGVTTPGIVRDELIRQRLMQAPRVPDVTAFGLPERDEVEIRASITLTAVRIHGGVTTVISSNTETHRVPWNAGPIALGLHLSGLLGEITKEVWGLNKTGTDESKPTEEN